MLTQTDVDLLYAQISSFVFKANTIDPKTKEPILDTKTCQAISSSLTNFIYAGVIKYIKGQQEHGGRLTDRDLLAEKRNEIIDLFFYNEADAWIQAELNERERLLSMNSHHKPSRD